MEIDGQTYKTAWDWSLEGFAVCNNKERTDYELQSPDGKYRVKLYRSDQTRVRSTEDLILHGWGVVDTPKKAVTVAAVDYEPEI